MDAVAPCDPVLVVLDKHKSGIGLKPRHQRILLLSSGPHSHCEPPNYVAPVWGSQVRLRPTPPVRPHPPPAELAFLANQRCTLIFSPHFTHFQR